MAGTIGAIYLASDRGVDVLRVDAADVTLQGVDGDRYERGVGTFSNGLADGRAITLIAAEALDAIADEGVDLRDGRHRRNLVTTGVDLNRLVHVKFRVGDAVLRGNRPCPPCGYLARLLGVDAKRLLRRRGGLRADVVVGGRVAVGDAVELLSP